MADPQTRYTYTFDRVVRLMVSTIAVIALFWLLRYLSDVLFPFALAVVLAYLLNPLVTFFERKTRRRGFAVILTLASLTAVGVAILAVVVPLVFSQMGRFRIDLEKLRYDLTSPAEISIYPPTLSPSESKTAGEAQTRSAEKVDADNVAGEHFSSKADAKKPDANAEKSLTGLRELKEGWALFRNTTDGLPRRERLHLLRASVSGTYVGQLIDSTIEYTQTEQFSQLLLDAVKRVVAGGWTVLNFSINAVLGLTGLIVVLLYLIFLLLDYPEYVRTWQAFLPPPYRKPIVDFLQEFQMVMRRYFRGQALVSLLMSALFIIGFSAISLPMAVPLGLFVGLLNMVPYLQTVGLVPALLLAGLGAVESDSSFAVSVLLTLLVFGVAQLIQETLITPRVMGEATGLKPIAILLGIFIWGKLLGFLGLLLAIPLTCLGIAYYRRYVLLHAQSAFHGTDA